MTWCAIRTLPGAQQPQREYVVEQTALRRDKNGEPINKGYRIVPSLNPHISAVEQALTRAGFAAYMPVDFKVVRNRKKTGAYGIRRFPILEGYVFVHGVVDFAALEAVPGVAHVVRVEGEEPLPIPVAEIMRFRTIEAKGEAQADRDILKITSQADSKARKVAAKALAAAKRKLVPNKVVKILWGSAVGHEATIAGWDDGKFVKVILDKLNAAEALSVPYDTLRLVNSDLEAAE